MHQEPQSSAAKLAWPTPTPPPCRRGLRRQIRAALQAAAMAAVATFFLLVGQRVVIGLILYSLSALVLVSGCCIPRLFNYIELGGRWLGRGVGLGLTWLLLTPFFYLCLLPGRLILLLWRKDPMHRRWEPERTSYWLEHKPSSPQSYTRQY